MSYSRIMPRWLKRAMRVGLRAMDPAPRAATLTVPASRAARAGKFVQASYTNAFGTRAYKAYVPARDEGQPRPLVVMLHGCKQDTDDFAAGTRMNELADEFGFIVAYPEQAPAANASRC